MSRQRPMEVIEKAEYVTIGELARLTDVRYSTLKFYGPAPVHPGPAEAGAVRPGDQGHPGG